MSLSSEIKIAEQRLSVLDLAKELGIVLVACRQRDMSWCQFYEYKRRFQTQGIEGLVNLPPIHHFHPLITPPEVVNSVINRDFKGLYHQH